MKSFVQFRALLALAVIAFAGSATPAFAEIVYNVTNFEATQRFGWSLAGTITVSGAGSFTEGSAITAWDLTATSASESHQYSNSTTTSLSPLRFNGVLNATSTDLRLEANSVLTFYADHLSNISWMNEYQDRFGTFSVYEAGWRSYKNPLGEEVFMYVSLWNFGVGHVFSPVVDGAWILGTAPSAVPEIDPAGMGSVLALVAGALGLLERRRLKMA